MIITEETVLLCCEDICLAFSINTGCILAWVFIHYFILNRGLDRVRQCINSLLLFDILKYILVLFLFSLSSAIVYGQQNRSFTVVNKTVADGLVDRNVLRVIGDSLGTCFFQTPLAIQKHYQNEFVRTLTLPVMSQNYPMMESSEFIFVMDGQHCLTIIDKQELIITKTLCISQLIEDDIAQIKPLKDKLLVLIKKGSDEYKITSYTLVDDNIVPTYNKEFTFTDSIITFDLMGDNIALIINEQNKLYAIDQDQKLIHQGCPNQEKSRVPKIYVNSKEEISYFSLMNCPGVYSLSSNYQLQELSSDGYIQFVSEDKAANSILGITKATILHCDELLQIDYQGDIISRPDILSANNRITDIYSEDFKQGMITSTYNGIFYFKFLEPGIDLFLQEEGISQSEFGHVVRGFSQSKEAILCVKEGGENIYALLRDSLVVDDVLSDIISYRTVWIDYDSTEQYTRIIEYDGEGKSYLYRHHPANDLLTIQLPFTAEKFHVDSAYVWITGRNNSQGIIMRLDKETHEQEFLWQDLLSDSHVRASYYGEEVYLFGTYDGLLIYHTIEDRLVHTSLDSTFDESVTFIKKMSNSYFVGTYNGLYVFEEDFADFKHINVSNSIAGNVVASIEQDSFANFWISTFSGMTVINEDLELVHKFASNTTLSSGEFNRSASLRDNQGDLYFGSINGFVRINPTSFYSSKVSQQLVLNELHIYEDNRHYALTTLPGVNRILGIPSKISLQFGAPEFNRSRSDNNIEEYQLNLYPSCDTLYAQDGLVYIEGLSSGTYRLYGQLRIEGSPEQLLATIRVRRNWSKILRNLLIIIGGTLILSLLMLRYFERKQKRLKEKLGLENEIINVKLKALRSQLNPHFIFNALNSIQYYIQTSEKKLARNYLNKFARLIRLILESSHYDHISISKEIEQLTLYLDLEKLRFEDKWDFVIELKEYINEQIQLIPSMILQPIIENAVIHGVGHLTDRKGLIHIGFEKIDEMIVVTIDDNGIGRTASRQINNKQNHQHNSLSTDITASRLKLFNTINSKNYTIDYTDKYDIDNQPTGTTVSIRIKDMHHGTA